MRDDQESIVDLTNENARLRATLDEIGRQAMACWMDMQGRLADDEHRRAHRALGAITKAASASRSSEPREDAMPQPTLQQCASLQGAVDAVNAAMNEIRQSCGGGVRILPRVRYNEDSGIAAIEVEITTGRLFFTSADPT